MHISLVGLPRDSRVRILEVYDAARDAAYAEADRLLQDADR